MYEFKNIFNLTQHLASEEQKKSIIDGNIDDQRRIRELLTFNEIPDRLYLQYVAYELAAIAKEYDTKYAMIGGAPYLMRALEDALMSEGIQPLYAFSKRESVETVLEDGTVQKISKFKNLGFVPA